MSEHHDDQPFRQRGFLISAGVVGVLILIGVVMTVMTLIGDDNGPDETAPPTPTTSQTDTSEPTASDPNESRCGLPGYEESGTLTQPPEDVTWELVGTIALPSTEAAGPGIIDDSGLRYCYAHTPEGALLMAANAFAWGEVEDVEAVIENSIASGPGKDFAEAELEAGTSGGDPSTSTVLMQIRGFRLLAYSGTSAVVDLGIQASPGQYLSLTVELAWEAGDWRLRMTPDGSLFTSQVMPDLTGFTPWAGA